MSLNLKNIDSIPGSYKGSAHPKKAADYTKNLQHFMKHSDSRQSKKMAFKKTDQNLGH